MSAILGENRKCSACSGKGTLPRGDEDRDCGQCFGTGMAPRSCVGCGHCCRTAPCMVAQRVYGPVASCPGLEWDAAAKRYWCRLCRLPGEMGEGYRKELHAGAGCCSPLNSDREEIPEPKAAPRPRPLSKDCETFLRYLCRGFISGDAIWLSIEAAGRELGKDWTNSAHNATREERPKHVEEFMG